MWKRFLACGVQPSQDTTSVQSALLMPLLSESQSQRLSSQTSAGGHCEQFLMELQTSLTVLCCVTSCWTVSQQWSSQWKNQNYPSVCYSWAPNSSELCTDKSLHPPLQWGWKAFPLQWDSYDFNQSHHKEIEAEKKFCNCDLRVCISHCDDWYTTVRAVQPAGAFFLLPLHALKKCIWSALTFFLKKPKNCYQLTIRSILLQKSTKTVW